MVGVLGFALNPLALIRKLVTRCGKAVLLGVQDVHCTSPGHPTNALARHADGQVGGVVTVEVPRGQGDPEVVRVVGFVVNTRTVLIPKLVTR